VARTETAPRYRFITFIVFSPCEVVRPRPLVAFLCLFFYPQKLTSTIRNVSLHT
jgi:hypothetical protein